LLLLIKNSLRRRDETMKKFLSLLTGAAVLISMIAAAPTMSAQKSSAEISGKWTISMWGAGKEESFPLEIKANGENLTITAIHPTFKEMTGTGTLKEDAVSIDLKSASMEMVLTGSLSGNKMSGTRKIKSSGGPGGAPGGQGGAPAGGQGGSAAGGQAGAPSGSAPGGGQGGAPAGQGGAPAGGQSSDGAGGNENWTAVKN
jgi:hypothetical protein